jgi:hypothetical protein
MTSLQTSVRCRNCALCRLSVADESGGQPYPPCRLWQLRIGWQPGSNPHERIVAISDFCHSGTSYTVCVSSLNEDTKRIVTRYGRDSIRAFFCPLRTSSVASRAAA